MGSFVFSDYELSVAVLGRRKRTRGLRNPPRGTGRTARSAREAEPQKTVPNLAFSFSTNVGQVSCGSVFQATFKIQESK
jgi:hypothetical protein